MPTTTNAPGSGSASAAGFSRRAVGSLLGRYQAPELFFQQPFSTLTSPVIPRNINLTRPLESLKLVWKGRVVIGVANFTAVGPEAPQTIIQRIRLTGTHRTYNQLAPIDISGATAFAWARIYQQRGSSLLIGGAAAQTREPELSMPIGLAGATFGNTGTYDLEIHYHIPLGPMLAPHGRIPTIPFMYFPQDWADTLQLQLFFGDQTSFGTPGGTTTTTFSAFGSGAGSPTVTILANYCILGPLANSVQGAVVVRNETVIAGGPVAAVANAQRLTLLQKQKTTNILVKSGTLFTGQSAGVSTFATLTDAMLERTIVSLDNKPVRNNQMNAAFKEYSGMMFNTILPQGYLLIPFIESQNPLTYYRGDQVPGGSTFELDSDCLTANANQAIAIVQEQVFGTPRGK